MKHLFFSLSLSLGGMTVATLLGPAAWADSTLPTLEPTNRYMFQSIGYGNDTTDNHWINLLEPEQLGNLQCIAVGNTNQMRCYGEQDYNVTIIPSTTLAPNINEFKIDDKDVHVRFGQSDHIGAMLRTHPSEANTSAILELGVQLD